ncbi:hypothetical protein GEMRC1_004773 [Eukaryota sp. GEM-RC1]
METTSSLEKLIELFPSYERQVSQLMPTITQLETDLRHKESQLQQLREQMQQKDHQLQHAQEQLKLKDDQLLKLQSHVVSRDDDLNRALSKIDRLQKSWIQQTSVLKSFTMLSMNKSNCGGITNNSSTKVKPN